MGTVRTNGFEMPITPANDETLLSITLNLLRRLAITATLNFMHGESEDECGSYHNAEQCFSLFGR